jgi:hypothetical protein
VVDADERRRPLGEPLNQPFSNAPASPVFARTGWRLDFLWRSQAVGRENAQAFEARRGRLCARISARKTSHTYHSSGSPLRNAQSSRGFLSIRSRNKHHSAEPPPTATYHLDCANTDSRLSELFEDVGDNSSAVVAANIECRSLTQFEFGLSCSGDKRGAVFGDEFELRPSYTLGIAPNCNEVHARIAHCIEHSSAFTDFILD